MIPQQEQPLLRIHLTNIIGLGAIKLLESLLPHIDNTHKFQIHELYLPYKGALSQYNSLNAKTKTVIYKRKLPNSISRLIECLFPNKKYDDGSPILVFGDIPLRLKKGNQTLFLQSSLLVTPWLEIPKLSALKYIIAKIIFYINIPYVKSFIVQTSVMKDKLLSIYPILDQKVYIVPQPVPMWVKNKNKKELSYTKDSKLNLIYPAAFYPHKNHKILSKIILNNKEWPILNLILTIDKKKNPAPNVDWVNCSGQLDQETLLKAYRAADGMLFLSKEESLGFPLIEAMYLGLPIVCPDLPFARVLCGDDAIYFDPNDIESLRLNINFLQNRLIEGWQPNWDIQMRKIPKNWAIVANEILDLCT